MTDLDGLLKNAGGARPASDVDALIERLLRYSILINGEPMMEQAAAALVQLRDSEALARGKIAEQMIKIEWLERMKQNYYDEAVKGWSKCCAAEAELDTQNRALAQGRALLKQEIWASTAVQTWESTMTHSELDALVARLHKDAVTHKQQGWDGDAEWDLLLAAAIAELRAEVARLQAAHDHQYAVAGTMLRIAERAEARIAALEGERDQWRDQDSRELKEWQAVAERMERERDALRADAVAIFEWMNRKGGMGLDVHRRIDTFLATWSKP